MKQTLYWRDTIAGQPLSHARHEVTLSCGHKFVVLNEDESSYNDDHTQYLCSKCKEANLNNECSKII